mgnify:CR=1 FL=1
MVLRVFRFFLFQLVGGLLGYWFWPGQARAPGIIFGIVCASAAWIVIDLRRSRKLLAWLREGDTGHPASVRGYWGEVADRSRRLIRSRDRLLQQSELRLQEFLAAIQASPNGVVLLDADGRIEWLNQTAAGHFGFDSQRDLSQLIGNLVRDPIFVSYLADGDFTHEAIMPGPASVSSRPMRLSVQLHRYGEGRKLLLSRDVTVLQQAEAMRRDFVANVSHEIRTPLTVLSGFVESMQNLPMGAAERQRYLGFMAQQALRMRRLVDDLLTLSRLEGSPPPGKDEWFDVRSLITQCEQEARDLSMLMTQVGHDLCADISDDGELAGSQVELHSAMANLVNNAIRYTPPGGKVVLRWRMLQDGSGEFSVTDTGPGIDPEHVPRLTERFYRIDRSRSRETGGTGLGLAIVKHVAQRHDAQLLIDSKPGQGSRFAILFPPRRVRPVVNPAKA